MTVTLADLQPGDLQFGPIGGLVPGVFPVAAGQLLLADRKARLTWRRWRKIRHCGVVTEVYDVEHVGARRPRLVQAMPQGAEEIELRADPHWTDQYVYVRPAYDFPLDQAGRAAWAARGYIGTPYNFLTYGALAARKLGFAVSDRLLRKWISTRKDMMCSQLVDQCLADAGFHVFDDGRLPQDVVPAELFRALVDAPGTRYVVPGMSAWAEAPSYWK